MDHSQQQQPKWTKLTLGVCSLLLTLGDGNLENEDFHREGEWEITYVSSYTNIMMHQLPIVCFVFKIK